VKRLGIFGGTFNPPHLAHLIAAERAVEEYSLDKLLFIPANIPPHKVGHEIAPADDRLAMIRLAAQDNAHFEISDIELKREGKSYTIDTLRELKGIYSPDSLYLFIGMDMFAIFDSWYKAEEILSLATVVVMLRPTHDIKAIDSKMRDSVQIMSLPLLEISSTDIRERVSQEKSIQYLVPECVRAYIEERGLYID
jgi:nicotinate-nucleotide adenylyltransferase